MEIGEVWPFLGFLVHKSKTRVIHVKFTDDIIFDIELD